MKNWPYIIGFLVILSACTKEEQAFSVDIAVELQPYIDMFVAEGAQRGINVDFTQEGLSAQLTNIETAGVPGQCHQHSHDTNELFIDQAFWKVYDEEQRELLIFHELGHCYLDRDHDDRSDANGNCISLMRSSSNSCIIENYSENRASLLDELFN